MSDENKTRQEPKKEHRDGLITELKIPQELIEDTAPHFKHNRRRFAGALAAMKVIALLAWFVALLAILLRLNDGSREYAFTGIIGGGVKQQAESAQRVFVLVSAAALALSSIGCLAGAFLCAKGAGSRPSEGRLLLILFALSLLMAGVLYFLW